MPDQPLAFFLTWTAYGTWLHGDERGSIDAQHNRPGTPRAPFNPVRETTRASQLKHKPFHLGSAERGVVHATIQEVCKHRGWKLLQQNVRTNHVHVIVVSTQPPDKTLRDLKAWCTRRPREKGLLQPDQPAWAEGGSTIWLWTEEQVGRKCVYVRDGQGADLPMG